MSYDLLLAFDKDEPAFALGFEAGRIWALLRTDDSFDHEPFMVHAANTEMMMRIAESCGRPFSATVIDETWTEIEFGAAEVTDVF